MITKITGPPGTGKTTTLCNIIKHHNKKGTSTKDILFCSFSNAAIQSIYNKLGISYDRRRKKLPWFRTLHGLCLSFLIKKPEYKKSIRRLFGLPNLCDSYYQACCRKNGIPIDFEISSDSKGNRAMNAWNRIVSENYPFKSLDECMDQLLYADEEGELHDIMMMWMDYKKEKGILDWIDMEILSYHHDIKPQDKNGNCPNIAMFDETQDLNQLEMILMNNIIEDIDDVYIVGDFMQSIYGFKGCDPKFFIDQDCDRTYLLPTSYRVPSNILEYSNKLADIMTFKDDRVHKLKSANEGGKVIISDNKYSIDDIMDTIMTYSKQNPNESIYVLCRTNGIAKKAQNHLLNQNLLYKTLKSNPVFNELPVFYNISYKINNNKPLSIKEYHKIVEYLPIKKKEKNKLLKDDNINILKQFVQKYDILEVLSKSKKTDISSILNKRIDRKDDRVILDILSEANEPMPFDNIYIDTMHSSKGLEADIVFILDALTGKVVKSLKHEDSGLDNELRLYYVAITRAKKAVVIVPLENHSSLIPRLNIK
jgi:DNA helicase-2/ATP-dependent DNA helicase PcrA